MLEDNIRTECYYGVLKKYKAEFPNAHFELIMRSAGHILSPSWQLLGKVKKGMSFKEYTPIFLEEMKKPNARSEIERLREIAEKKMLFLVCYEIDAKGCHRSLVKNLILENANEKRGT